MGGKNAKTLTRRGTKAARTRARDGLSKDELYHRAQAKGIAGRSKMSKRQLENALHA